VSKTVGNAFEQRALEYLQRQRMRFVARNFVCWGGEIDLVMRDLGGDRALMFVEVRARRSRQFAGAAASIGAQAAAAHPCGPVLHVPWRGGLPACRFDVIAFDAGQIVWLRDAFRTDEA
jgi:putative endonuclease